MERNNYITILGFMVTDLKLSGNELIVYAIIYGFSQGQQGKFTGSTTYLAEWCNSSKRNIYRNLTSLIEKGLIKKEEYENHGQKFCDYYVTDVTNVTNVTPGDKMSPPGDKMSHPW